MKERSFQNAEYRFGFNGKENDTDFGSHIQDYGFRLYSRESARFLSVDPLTRSYSMLTPYQFAHNSPIALIDLDGLEGIMPPAIGIRPILPLPVASPTTEQPIVGNTMSFENWNARRYMRFPVQGNTIIDLYATYLLESMIGWNEITNSDPSNREPIRIIREKPEDYPGWYIEEVEKRVEEGRADHNDRKLVNEILKRRASFDPSSLKTDEWIGPGFRQWVRYKGQNIGFFVYDFKDGVQIELNIPPILRGQGIASRIFAEAVEDAEKFTATWVKSEIYSDEKESQSVNLTQFNYFVKEKGLTREKAAWKTWSGRQAKKHGFTNVEVVDLEDGGIKAIFTK